jgi:16S rRNA (cytosine967-C5)-methyltransferase
MGESTPRAVLLGMLRRERKQDTAAIAALCSGARFAPPPLTQAETAALERDRLTGAPAYVEGDYPEWLDPHLSRVFGDERAEEGAALSSRAPLDLRVNLIAGKRDEVLPKLGHLEAMPTRWSPLGIRIRLAPDARSLAIHAEPVFLKGQVEIQDEGSQLAVSLADAKPGEQVVDLCAGAGGKTLALAAAMENHGQIYATDIDKRRLAPIHERIARAGARNIQVRTPPTAHGGSDILADLAGRADLVMIDAPCTGTGAWRRNPDAKWRVRPGALAERIKQQDDVLERAARLVKPGGRIAYITCSVLAEENGDRVLAFLVRHPEFSVEKPAELLNVLGERAYLFRRAVLMSEEGLLMTPRRTDTDGFFVSVLRRQSAA